MGITKENQMGFSTWGRISLAALLAALLTALFAPLAQASTADIIAPSPVGPGELTADNGWQAGTCKSDGPPVCSVETESEFFEEAAAHPPVGFTQFIVRNEPSPIPIVGGPEQP